MTFCRFRKIACALFLFAGATFFSITCGDSQDKGGLQASHNQAEAVSAQSDSDAGEQKDDFLREAEDALDVLDQHIQSFKQKLDERWAEMAPQARQEAEKVLEGMKKKRRALSEKLKQLEESSAEAWKDLKKEFRNSFESLKETLEEHFRQRPEKEVTYI